MIYGALLVVQIREVGILPVWIKEKEGFSDVGVEDTGSSLKNCSIYSFVRIGCAEVICRSWDVSEMAWKAR